MKFLSRTNLSSRSKNSIFTRPPRRKGSSYIFTIGPSGGIATNLIIQPPVTARHGSRNLNDTILTYDLGLISCQNQ